LSVLKERPRVIFCGHLFMAPLGAVLALLCRAKLVVQLHGIEAWKKPTHLQRWAVSRAELVLCVSRYTRERITEWGDLPPERILVLPNTVRDMFVPGDRSVAREQFGLKDEQVLLSVGRLDAREGYKGYDIVIDIVAHLKKEGRKIRYLIAGEGADRIRLEDLVRAQKVEANVQFLGTVADDKLPELYRAADVFVLPSTGEGFGIVFLEAMACGTPVLGLGVAGARDALADGQLGIGASPENVGSELVKALALARMADGGQLERAVRGRFGRPQFAVRAARIFNALTA
jgi:phosphatidyl-myo-inositol dimannoside synthase